MAGLGTETRNAQAPEKICSDAGEDLFRLAFALHP
jgi:hypothetical protein